MKKPLKLIYNAFQKYCLPPICSICDKNLGYICPSCLNKLDFQIHKTTLNHHNHFYFSTYTPTLQKIIQSIKFHHYQQALTPLNNHLEKTNHIKSLISHYDAWIPVPYHPIKRYKRGYNLIEKLFKPLFDTQGIPVINCLERTKYTQALSKLSDKKRKKILKNVFKASQKTIIKLEKKRVVLVDDIVTTQTTMTECINILHNTVKLETLDCLSLIKA